jgi:predicted transcriptional regulator
MNNDILIQGMITPQTAVQNEIGLKRIDLEILIRFLNILSASNSVGITNLQMKTGTNHFACQRYVSVLRKFGFAETLIDGKKKSVYLTEKGREVVKLLSAE